MKFAVKHLSGFCLALILILSFGASRVLATEQRVVNASSARPLSEAVASLSAAPNASLQSTGTFGLLEYRIDESSVTVTGCDKSVVSLEIPDQIDDLPVTAIDNGAFSDCTSLQEVVIPDSVTSIGYAAFSECSALCSVTMPGSVGLRNGYGYSGSPNVFRGCTAISHVTLTGTGWAGGGGNYVCFPWFFSWEDQVTVELREGITSIGSDAFRDFSHALTVIIPESVVSTASSGTRSIGMNAPWRENCSSFTKRRRRALPGREIPRSCA